jgi:hypothetical protein
MQLYMSNHRTILCNNGEQVLSPPAIINMVSSSHSLQHQSFPRTNPPSSQPTPPRDSHFTMPSSSSHAPWEPAPRQVCSSHRRYPDVANCSTCDRLNVDATDRRQRAETSRQIIDLSNSTRNPTYHVSSVYDVSLNPYSERGSRSRITEGERGARSLYDDMERRSQSHRSAYQSRESARRDLSEGERQRRSDTHSYRERTYHEADEARSRIAARDNNTDELARIAGVSRDQYGDYSSSSRYRNYQGPYPDRTTNYYYR